MAINTYPAIASPVKSVQRGSAGGSGNVTITAVDISKSMVNVFGTAASGTVAAAGAIAATTLTVPITTGRSVTGTSYNTSPQPIGVFNYGIPASPSGSNTRSHFMVPAHTDNIAATNLSGGSTNLVAAVVTGFLANSTTLTVSGACRWEVVEFN